MFLLGALDQGVLDWFQAHRTPLLDSVVINLTDLGQSYVLTLATVIAAGWFLAVRRPRAALLLVTASLASILLVEGVKHTVQRLRPEGVQPAPPSLLSGLIGAVQDFGEGVRGKPVGGKQISFSFPSSHALGSAAIYGTLALLAAHRLRRRWLLLLVIAFTAALVLVIGVCRLYLGVHYFTDVVAGWAAGLGLALVCGWLDENWALPREAAPDANPRGWSAPA
jgi:undecaprenyl-diphosphatase